MTKSILFGTVAMALAVAACGRANDEATSNDLATDNMAMENAGADANAAATAPVAAGDFANMAAASDHYEIEVGKLAASKASSADVKAFGQMLVDAHTKSTADLMAAASQSTPPVTPNDALDAEKQGMLDMLQSAGGTDFDGQFLDQQIMAHEKALALLQSYAAGGDNEALKGFAAKTAPAVQEHLDKARALRK
jgi:putative membrane protein